MDTIGIKLRANDLLDVPLKIMNGLIRAVWDK